MQKIIFSEDDDMAWVYRTFSHSFPELFIEEETNTKSALEKALDRIDKTFWAKETDMSCMEVSSVFPLDWELIFWELSEVISYSKDNIAHNAGIKQREITYGQGKFIVRERIWKKNILEVHQCWEYLDFPFEINTRHKNFILSQLKNRKAVLSLWNCQIENQESIEDVLKGKFEDFRQLWVWLSHEDMLWNIHLLRNWEFMFWYLYFFKRSTQK